MWLILSFPAGMSREAVYFDPGRIPLIHELILERACWRTFTFA
jgi:hypothetical protein